MCNIKKERVSTNSLLSQLKLKSLHSVLRCNRLQWFEHVKRSKLYTGQILDLHVDRNRIRGCINGCWLDAIKEDLRTLNLQVETCQYRSEWREWLKTACHTHTHTHTRRACNVTLMNSEWVYQNNGPSWDVYWRSAKNVLQYNYLWSIKLLLEIIFTISTYSLSDNETPPISQVLVVQHLIFDSLTSPLCCTCLENVCQSNIRRGKKLGFKSSHKHPLQVEAH